ncbi:hypothetical protein CGRA01v4_10272 [Colletotrichum graminicola]|nr:hypothetical protein CGRA01v4_10272 [Colletotrichum graminicola]
MTYAISPLVEPLFGLAVGVDADCIAPFEWRLLQSASWRIGGGCHAASPADAWLCRTMYGDT